MKRVPLGLALALSALPALAQSPGWNPLNFPSLPPPAQGAAPVSPTYPHPGTSPAGSASPTYPQGPVYPAPGASPASPASPVSPVYPETAVNANAVQSQGVGTTSTPAETAPPAPGKRLVFKRVRAPSRFGVALGANGFEIYTGEGEDAQLADWVVKSAITTQFNVKENPQKENRAFYLRTRRGNWEYSTITGSYELTTTKCLELRVKDTGFEAYNRAGQKFGAVRWGQYQPDPAKPARVVERVYTLDGRIVASLVAARINDSPALVLRKGSGAAAVPTYAIVFQDWAGAPHTSPGGGTPGFDDLAGGPAPAPAATAATREEDEAHLTGVAMFLDAWILSKAWRDGVGIAHNIQE